MKNSALRTGTGAAASAAALAVARIFDAPDDSEARARLTPPRHLQALARLLAPEPQPGASRSWPAFCSLHGAAEDLRLARQRFFGMGLPPFRSERRTAAFLRLNRA